MFGMFKTNKTVPPPSASKTIGLSASDSTSVPIKLLPPPVSSSTTTKEGNSSTSNELSNRTINSSNPAIMLQNNSSRAVNPLSASHLGRSTSRLGENQSRHNILDYLKMSGTKNIRDNDDVDSNDDDGSASQSVSGNSIYEEEYIKNGSKGVVVFDKIYCVKTDRYKTFHLHLKSGIMQQFFADSRTCKKFQCSDILGIKKNSKKQVVVKVKHSMDISSQNKKYCFDDEETYERFRKYVEFLNSTGSFIRAAFEEIDKLGLKVIKKSALDEALTQYEIDASEDDINKMMALRDRSATPIATTTSSDTNDGEFAIDSLEYHDFFHLYFEMDVTSTRDCLLIWLSKARQLMSSDNYNSNIATSLSAVSLTSCKEQQIKIDLLVGETVRLTIDVARWALYASSGKTKDLKQFSGKFFLTNYRLFFVSFIPNQNFRHSNFEISPFFDKLTLPLSTIYRAQMIDSKTIGFLTKDNRYLRLQLIKSTSSEELKTETVLAYICKEAFMESKDHSLKTHAFAYKFKGQYAVNGWIFSDLRKEYARQGLNDSVSWKMIDNSDFALIETYPKYLIIPSKVSQETLERCIKHRSKQRFPAITFRYPNGALLSRSAQPISGLLNSCDDDELLLNVYRTKGNPGDPSERDTKYYIYDARRQIAATLNRAAGKGGTENAASYINTELIYCNIDNIHVMRQSYESLMDLTSPGAVTDTLQNDSSGGVTFFQKLEDSGWLRHIRLILLSCVRMAERMNFEQSSVLVHCSDGWDRTAQLCSITQLILDPYFRTLEGLATLIEKEWCCFGFKFNDRCGHYRDHSHKPDERSPVFIQFLDTLHQILIQFPTCFEYSEQLLVFLGDHQYSGLFGTFLGNYEKMRQDLKLKEETVSIWSYVFENKDIFLNQNYVAYVYPIWPCTHPAKLRLWSRFHLRWDYKTHPNALSGSEWHDDWGNGLETLIPRDTSLQTETTLSFPLRVSTSGSSRNKNATTPNAFTMKPGSNPLERTNVSAVIRVVRSPSLNTSASTSASGSDSSNYGSVKTISTAADSTSSSGHVERGSMFGLPPNNSGDALNTSNEKLVTPAPTAKAIIPQL